MKKLLIVAILLMVVSVASYAQVTANISATVNANITLARTNDLALGAVNRGGTVTVLSTAAGAAAFTLSGGAANATTNCTFTVPANLTDVSSHTMPFTAQIPRSNTVANQAASSAFADITGGSATTSAAGALWLWIGGGVTADPAQVAGVYSGTITLTVTQP